jgi:hypothetical protein
VSWRLAKRAGLALVPILLIAAAYHVGSRAGYDRASAEAGRAQLLAVARAWEQAERIAREDAELLAAHAAREAERQARASVTTRTVYEVIERPVYRDCRLDARGLCLARAAARGAPAEDCPADADGALPAAPGAGGRNDG